MGCPEVFELEFRVAPEDIDALGHVNNIVYLRYAQDVAAAHWFARATREQSETLIWVVRRHEIDYLRPALQDDELIARTWVGAASGATFERLVEIRRRTKDQILARVRTIWVLLDAKTRRPRRVDDGLRMRFEGPPGASAGGARATASVPRRAKGA